VEDYFFGEGCHLAGGDDDPFAAFVLRDGQLVRVRIGDGRAWSSSVVRNDSKTDRRAACLFTGMGGADSAVVTALMVKVSVEGSRVMTL
jgi:hypothetical protein